MTPTAEFDKEVDVLVVGSGAGGMASALRANANGLDTLIIEKTEYFGGSTARSGGGAWVPNAPALLRKGERDDPQQILEYLERIAGEKVTRERLERYVTEAPKMMEFLEGQSEFLRTGFFWIEGYSDYHPDRGGNPKGRGVWAVPIDRRLLGADVKYMRPGIKRMQLPLGAWITSVDLHDLLALRWKGLRQKSIVFKLAYRVARARITGERVVASGAALIARLLLAVREHGITIWDRTPMLSLITEDGRVVGVEAERNGRPYRIRAKHGVILATGGFDHNLAMRRQYQPGIEDQEWSLGSPDNLGDGHHAGEAVGGYFDLMDDAWWMPTMKMHDGTLFGLVAERQFPGQFIVNANGDRFVNESTPYCDFVHAQIQGHVSGVPHIPAWMIVDSRAFNRNFIAGHVPGTPLPKAWTSEKGPARTGQTLDELAAKIGVPADRLRATAERFNQFARQGHDDDFGRGDSAYDRYYGDPSYANPNLAEVSEPPFYAFAITPGDLGTKGGLVTDEDARVLRQDGSAIEGLYATGNVSSAVMGNDYAGPGATIGPAMTFGYVAADHIAALRDAAGAAASSAPASPPSHGNVRAVVQAVPAAGD